MAELLKGDEEKVDTYKNILNTVIQPLCDHDEDLLRMWITRLKRSDGEGWAVGETLERALRYIRMTVALANEAPQEVTDEHKNSMDR